MKTRSSSLNALTIVAALAIISPASRADEKLDATKKEVVASYAAIAGYSSADAHRQALALQSAITAFTAAPSAELHQKAKQAWVAARLPYLQSEVFRISDASAASLDAPPTDYLKSADAKAGGGFRAIEFVLWGEDNSADGPGGRSFEEFVIGKGADADRHGQFLNASAALVAEELAAIAADWGAGSPGNASAKLSALPVDEALKAIVTNVASLAGDELAKKRIGTAYHSRDQKDESSNFSDMTHLDVIYGCSGIANVVAGAYVGADKEIKVQGAGLLQLATTLDPEKGDRLKLATNRMMLAATDFRPPFDRALLAPDDSPAREAIKEMMDALAGLVVETADLAKALGISIP